MIEIEILDRCEDSNEFPVGMAGTGPIDGVTIGHRPRKFSTFRVDKFPAGWRGDLPDEQAQNLIRLGLAKAV